MSQKMLLLIFVLLATFGLQLVQSQDIPHPSRFSQLTAELLSVNGSSATGHCSNSVPIAGNTDCGVPTSSVLFDGNIPTLTGLDGDMWASQLLTIQKSSSFIEINFEFTIAGFLQVGRVEVVIFNCPEWGIAVESLRLLASISRAGVRDLVRSVTPTLSSCDSLVRLCLSGPSTLPILTLQFFPPPGSNWVHIAEVTFYSGASTCPSQTTVATQPTTPPPPTTPEVTTPPTTPEVTTPPTTPEVTTPPTTPEVTTRPRTTPEMTTILVTSQTTTDAETTPEVTPEVTTADITPPTTTTRTGPVRSTTTSDPQSPLTSDPESLIQRQVCTTSLILASVSTAIATALLATVIFVLVQIAVCKCHPKFTPGGAEN